MSAKALTEDILLIANHEGINYAKDKHKNEYGDPAFERDISETEIDFARGFVAGYFHYVDQKVDDALPRGLSLKVHEAQYYVDKYIEKNGIPPTYDMVAEAFCISKTAVYARLRKYRHKMKKRNV